MDPAKHRPSAIESDAWLPFAGRTCKHLGVGLPCSRLAECVAFAVVLACAAAGCSFDRGPLSSGSSKDGGEPGGGRAGDGAGAGGAGAGGAGAGGAGGARDAGGHAGTDASGVDAGSSDAGTDAAVADAGMDAGLDAALPEVCVPLSDEPCYTGPDATEGVGPCLAGTRTCKADGSGYGDCDGEVLPATPACGADEDLDCDGVFDGAQGVDADGDGYGTCEGDCCDDATDCDGPGRINPGAYDFPSDGVDDDCSGVADDATSCDSALTSNASDALDYARAIELCAQTTQSPPLEQRRWGVLSAGFSLTAGSGAPAAAQRSIRPDFGAITPQHGVGMLVMSSGTAAAVGDLSPAYTAPSPGTDQNTTSTAPADWLTANGGEIPASPGCPGPSDDATYDSVMLTLSVRVPTNAQAFTVRAYFLTAEYPEWVCSFYGDYFVSLLRSSYAGAPANPADLNLATYLSPADEVYPISANLPHGATGLFQQCVNGPTGCQSVAVAGSTSSCIGVAELAGTGMDAPAPGACDASALVGGGTGWLRIGGNVVPGETIELRLALWDNADALGDSHVLLDAFTWLPEPITPGTVLAD